MDQNALKKAAAEYALRYVTDECILGIGTGSTVNFFIEALVSLKGRIDTLVASSEASAQRLKALGFRVQDLNTVPHLDVYIDGADEANAHKQLIKGGGGALTREKILADAAKQFVCLIDESKKVDVLGDFPVAVEVLPLARSLVGRGLVKLGGDPAYREGFVSDNGNIILDVYNLDLTEPLKMEQAINQLSGVVCNGIFAQRTADILVIAGKNGIELR